MNLSHVRPVLVLVLGLIALARPLASIVVEQSGHDLGAAPRLLLTAAITLVWVAAVGLSRAPRPVLTLVLAGLVYAVVAIVLSGILSPLLLGHLAGPLAQPLAIVPMLVVNALWGLVAGLLALGVRHLRGAGIRSPGAAATTAPPAPGSPGPASSAHGRDGTSRS
ncbi:hypothetical protein [Brachybacterium conglomeratum]|uniref:hypothetical protein n=1 Tax=Brachybacterium conglomeratum TaxID=47846 RepID=UPI003DA11A9F